jgi:hypothetical protein
MRSCVRRSLWRLSRGQLHRDLGGRGGVAAPGGGAPDQDARFRLGELPPFGLLGPVVMPAKGLWQHLQICSLSWENSLRLTILSVSGDWRGYCQAMPRVSAFYGVVIYTYWNERDHPVAHFHAYHAGRRASVSADGEVLAGSLEPRALQFVREWAALRPAIG